MKLPFRAGLRLINVNGTTVQEYVFKHQDVLEFTFDGSNQWVMRNLSESVSKGVGLETVIKTTPLPNSRRYIEMGF